jgi:rhodanese-related sulfurtransferase
MREMPATELHEYLQQEQTERMLLDVREPWEYDICHIEGSTLLPMRELQLKMAELDSNKEIIVICHHGIRSRLVCRMLEREGFGRIINLSDGVDGWARTVDKNMSTY